MAQRLWVFFSLLLVLSLALASTPAQAAPGVTVELIEKIPNKPSWDFKVPPASLRFSTPAFGLVGVPSRWSDHGVLLDWTNPYLLSARSSISLPGGAYRLVLRARGAARLFVDGKVVLQTRFIKANASGHEHVHEQHGLDDKSLYPLTMGHQEKVHTLTLKPGSHDFRLDAIIGGKNVRAEVGELVVGLARQGERFHLLGPGLSTSLDEEGWDRHIRDFRAWLEAYDTRQRRKARANDSDFWEQRRAIARSIWEKKRVIIPEVNKDTPVHNAIDRFIGQRLEQAGIAPAPLTGDHAFLRRVSLDTVGVIPTPKEIQDFLADRRPDRRDRVIDRLLADPRWADHWVAYWQDVLAENPGILKPMLNNTGPFRFWILQAFRDNLPMDRFVTELVMMKGSQLGGGPGGFALATQNDVPMAAKAQVLAKAFLAVELKCARCHDAPHHPYLQKNTFQLAALLGRAPQTVPKTSTVPLRAGGRQPRVEITLKPGARVDPAWPFPQLVPPQVPDTFLRNPQDHRERLAALLTSPDNQRFARVMVNRLWKRYLGRGLVEPVDDWLDSKPTHPELLDYLAREFVISGYDLKHVACLILTSHTYQRQVMAEVSASGALPTRLFSCPTRRRMSAEQLVDSLFLLAGKEFHSEPLTMDPEGRRSRKSMLNLGQPTRAWGFTSLSNERDRPALALPVAQSLTDLLEVFGWRQSRPDPISERDETPTPLQPLLLANGVVGRRITSLSDDSALTTLSLQDKKLGALIDAVFLRILSRPPRPEERSLFLELLQEGFADRRVPGARVVKRSRRQLSSVSWSNHLSPEATRIKLELERLAQEGDPATARLRTSWRERMEDMVWALVNSPEFVFVP
jgi:hypothetical protein